MNKQVSGAVYGFFNYTMQDIFNLLLF